MVFHHIAFDGWSLGVLRRELSLCYAACRAGRSPALTEAPVDYSDYAVWQRRHWKGAAWRPALEGAPAAIDFAVAAHRPNHPTHRGGCERFVLDSDLCRRLREFGRTRDSSMYMALLAGYYLLLHRYSRQTDIVVGTPVANRDAPEVQDVIGFFVNTLAVRSRFSAGQGFEDLLISVREAVLDAFSHADIPFEKLVEAHNPPRSSAHSPLFQAMFILQNTPAGELNLPGLDVAEHNLHNGSAMFDLTLSIEEAAGEFHGSLEYNLDLFSPEMARCMTRSLRNLLEEALAAPDRPLADLEMLAPEDRKRALDLGRGSAVPVPETDLPTMFAERAAVDPEAVALIDGNGAWTYRDVARRANAVAARLWGLGVRREEPVGISLARSFDLVAALLGVVQAGAAWVPLDPSDPDERLAAVLERSGARFVLAGKHTGRGFHNATVLCVEEIPDADRAPCPALPPEPGRLAYILFTSGSTGQPKGVAGEHRAVVNRLQWMWSRFPFAPEERCCLKTTLSFVDSVWEIFGGLLAGRPSVIVSEETVRDARLLVETLGRHRVTRIVLVPSLLRALLDAYPGLGERLPDLRYWTLSGEALPADLAARFFRALPGRTLINLYGSSEVCADVTCQEVREPETDAPPPIGRPIDNCELQVLDERGRLLPPGCPGELYVAGIPLARGYWRDAALTEARFVERGGIRMFRTGDRVRWREDGALDFAGRIDNQVKIRGHRVELDEVSGALLRQPGVRNAAAVLRAAPAGSEAQLAAFVVRQTGAGELDLAAIKSALRASLPEVMVPAVLMELPALPLLPNGKLDAVALAGMKIEASRAEPAREKSDLEVDLCFLWGELLGRTNVGVSEDFFDLGGSSLDAIRLFARIEANFGRVLPVSTIFDASTVERLAGKIRETPAMRDLPLAVPLRTEGDRAPLFCFHTKEGTIIRYLHLTRALGPDLPVYGIQAAGLDGRRAQETSFVRLAAQYAAELRAVQPRGPYRLCGHCYGGFLAFAVAQELARQGESVSFLGLIDTRATELLQIRSRWERMTLRMRRVPRGLRKLISLGPGWFARNRAAWTHWLGNNRIATQDNRCINGPVAASLQTAILGFRARAYHGSATVFRSSELDAYYDEGTFWRRLVRGELRVVDVPGDHMSMVQPPSVEQLAESMRPFLD
jgi:amino acid adenylation domain-containing protein